MPIKPLSCVTRLSRFVTLFALISLTACSTTSTTSVNDTVMISVIGTNDVHGQLLPRRTSGGLAVFSGYVNALRDAREDNGSVLLIDAGDMWQGTLESNLSEGAAMVEAYNALGYDAVTIGNHEFDFGPVGERSTPAADEDARGALKARAAEAKFPLLAANLIDDATGTVVDWPNVSPSVMLETSGIKVGVIGVMTHDALSATIAANVRGLRVTPLAPTIIQEARKLRKAGARLVIVTAHAGGGCREFDDPTDLSSCDPDDEIIQVARELPENLVDHIIAGHHHRGIAHIVNGVAITAAYSSSRSFGRVDYTLDRRTGNTLARRIHPPRRVCPLMDSATAECAWEQNDDGSLQPARYEDRALVPSPSVVAIVERARQQAQALKARRLGVYLETPITTRDLPESALGNLMTDALLDTSTADISIHNVHGGIRADLPAGDLTFGGVYQVFPFDNRVVLLELTGADIRKVIAGQAHRGYRRAGFSGMTAHVSCQADKLQVILRRKDGSEIADHDPVTLAVNDFLALGGDNILTPIIPEGGFRYPSDTPQARDLLVDWLEARGGTLSSEQFLGERNRRWYMPKDLPASCTL